MKKYMKLLSTLILFSTLALGIASCSDDNESLDNYWASIVTVNKIGENKYDFTLDDGRKIWVASPSGLNLKPEYDRALIYYTILSEEKEGYDLSVRLGRFYDVLTKEPIYIAKDNQIKQDSIGNDPIKVYSMWEGGGYLNISFGFNVGGQDTNTIKHMINLVSDNPDLSVNEESVSLEFRHNQKGDPQNYLAEGYVSFDLTPYKVAGRDKVTFEIKWKDFGGEVKSKKIEYKYNSAVTQPENLNLGKNYDTNLNIY